MDKLLKTTNHFIDFRWHWLVIFLQLGGFSSFCQSIELWLKSMAFAGLADERQWWMDWCTCFSGIFHRKLLCTVRFPYSHGHCFGLECLLWLHRRYFRMSGDSWIFYRWLELDVRSFWLDVWMATLRLFLWPIFSTCWHSTVKMLCLWMATVEVISDRKILLRMMLSSLV